jgi:sucrose phosphorylase
MWAIWSGFRDNSDMEKSFEDLCAVLYGGATVRSFQIGVRDLMRRHGLPDDSARDPWRAPLVNAKDVLLITYGDQIREAARLPLESLGGFLERRLSDVVSGVHILPFYPYSSDDGFSVIDYFAVDPALGSWADIQRLGRSFDLMFDAVFNHMSARSEWFRRFLSGDSEFRDFFVTVEGEPDLSQVVRPRALPLLTPFPTTEGMKNVWTTFSADQVDLNFRNPKVMMAVLDALLFYVARGARFIRLDAIAFLWKEIGTPCLHLPQTHAAIQLMRAVLDEAAPGVVLITETNVPHRDNVSYFGDGSNEAQLVYNFALPPLVLHSIQTGSASALSAWATALELPAGGKATFFNFLASHDGIGVNPVRGILEPEEIQQLVDRTLAHGGFVSFKNNPDGSRSPYELNINFFDALSNPGGSEPLCLQIDRFLAAQAIMLSVVGVPGIYFHSLLGSRGDRAGAEQSGIPRRINRQKLDCAAIESELAERGSLRSRVFLRFRELLRLRRSHAAFDPYAPHRIIAGDSRVFAVIRVSADQHERILCLHNVSDQAVSFDLGRVADTTDESWLNLLDEGRSIKTGVPVELEPYEVIWALRTTD